MAVYTFGTYQKASYPGFVCVVCLKTMSEFPLRRCSGCKLFFYCCKEHQISHWPQHKELCKVNQSSLKKPVGDFIAETFAQKKNLGKVLSDLLTNHYAAKMQRRLTQDEYIMLNNPFLCKVCHIYNDKQMITCKECFTTTYCSVDYKNEDAVRHSLICSELKKILDYSKNFNGYIITLAAVKGFIKLPIDIKSFVEEIDIVKTEPREKEVYVRQYLMELFTIPLTVIYAIEKGLSGNKIKNNYLTIHVVGCRQFENAAVATWEYIFHNFRALKSINLIFIGPETSLGCLSTPIVSCMECINSGEIINFRMEPMKYHEYLMKKLSEKPDIIICFHCGFYSYKCLIKNETWKDSMQSLCSFPGTTVAFTSYNKIEAKEDLKIFKEYCGADKLEFLIEGELNPYRNLLPKFSIGSDIISYDNCYITVAKS